MPIAKEIMPKKREDPKPKGKSGVRKAAMPQPLVVPPRKGRPKRGGRLQLRYAVVHTPEHRKWMDEFMAFTGDAEVSDVIRDAIRKYAESLGFRTPPKL